MTFTFILNPAARAGRAARLAPHLAAWAEEAGLQARVVQTTGAGHAAGLAAEAGARGEAVVAVGGDGTVHEVVRGLVAAGAGVPLGVVPCGTGNDFVKMTGAPRRPRAAVAALARFRPRPFDYGVVRWTGDDGAGERPFVNAVGAGFDGAVAAATTGDKRLPGPVGYLVAALALLRRWPGPSVRVAVDGRVLHDGPLLLVATSNGRSSGGHFLFAPHARADDGQFDVCGIPNVTPGRVLQLIPRVLVGRHLGAPEVIAAQARTVELTATDPLPVHADGEVLSVAARRVEIRIVPGGLRVFRPA